MPSGRTTTAASRRRSATGTTIATAARASMTTTTIRVPRASSARWARSARVWPRARTSSSRGRGLPAERRWNCRRPRRCRRASAATPARRRRLDRRREGCLLRPRRTITTTTIPRGILPANTDRIPTISTAEGRVRLRPLVTAIIPERGNCITRRRRIRTTITTTVTILLLLRTGTRLTRAAEGTVLRLLLRISTRATTRRLLRITIAAWTAERPRPSTRCTPLLPRAPRIIFIILLARLPPLLQTSTILTDLLIITTTGTTSTTCRRPYLLNFCTFGEPAAPRGGTRTTMQH
mmetsp:Transcript_24115/g.46125  ORF Transcript_24115/g.46125 Transcript_24115/m.46125 type:complete len:293 (+) Transcript_24115:1092-1970(+)